MLIPSLFFHRGCVTVSILAELSAIPLKNIIGFGKLKLTFFSLFEFAFLLVNHRDSDQNKIRMAVSLGRIDPNDIPTSAKPRITSVNNASQPSSSQGKRTATQAGLDLASQRLRAALSGGSSTAHRSIEEEIEEEPSEEEIRDEIYCNMVTSVVGIQYYKGLCPNFVLQGFGERSNIIYKAWLAQVKRSCSSENLITASTSEAHFVRQSQFPDV